LDQPPYPKIAYLDSVRGLAALAVIGSHYVRAYDLPCHSNFCDRLLTYSPLHIAWDGGAAVSLFFVLSGLVLSLKHFRHSLTPDLSHYPLGAFILRRIFRIWPPYLVVLAVSALLYSHYQRAYSSFPATVPRQNDWLHSLWGRPMGWVDFFKDSFLLGMRMEMQFLPQAWTLSVELALSLLVPVGILLAARSSAWLVFFTLFAIHALGVSPFLFDFVLGILLAKHHQALTRWLRVQRFHRAMAWLIGLFLYTIGDTFEVWINPNDLGWLTGLGCGLLLLCSMASVKFQRILSFPTLRYLGKVSYSIYLIHFAVLINATPLFLSLLDASDDGFIFAWWLGFAATLVGSVSLAGLSYRFVEVPSMAMGKRLGRIAQG
jgi:peptidoglycan/LPS O-acetylase OafA/YrhL